MFILPKKSRLLHRQAGFGDSALDGNDRVGVLYLLKGFFRALWDKAINEDTNEEIREILLPFADQPNDNLMQNSSIPLAGTFYKQFSNLQLDSLDLHVSNLNNITNKLNDALPIYDDAKEYLIKHKFNLNKFSFSPCINYGSGTPVDTDKTFTSVQLDNMLVNSGVVKDPEQTNKLNKLTALASTFSYKNKIYKIYVYQNSGNVIVGVITNGNSLIPEKQINRKSNSNSDTDCAAKAQEVYKYLEENELKDMLKGNFSELNDMNIIKRDVTRVVNDKFKLDGNSINLVTTDWQNSGNNSSNNNEDAHATEPLEFRVEVSSSNYNLLEKLILYCIKAKDEKCSLQSFKLTKATTQANRSRLRSKTVFGYNMSSLIHLAAKNGELFTAFKQLFSNFGFAQNLELISSYYNPTIPKDASVTPTNIQDIVNDNNNCVGILVKTSTNKFIIVPYSALASLRTFYHEFKRISDTIQSTHWLKTLPQYASHIYDSIKSTFTEVGFNLLDRVKNLLSSNSEYDKLKNYDRDMTNIVLSRRLSDKMGSNTDNTDKALLALITKKVYGIKIFDSAIEADKAIHSLTNSQFTFLHNTLYRNHIKYTKDLINQTGPNKRPESAIALVMVVDKTKFRVSDFFGARFRYWYQHDITDAKADEVILNNDKVKEIIQKYLPV